MKLWRLQLYRVEYTGKPHPAGGWAYTKKLLATVKMTEFMARHRGFHVDTIAAHYRYAIATARNATDFSLAEYSPGAGDYGDGKGWLPIICGTI